MVRRHVERLAQADHRQRRLIPAAVVPDLEIGPEVARPDHAVGLAKGENHRPCARGRRVDRLQFVHGRFLCRQSKKKASPAPAAGSLPSSGSTKKEWRSEEHSSELQSLMRISYAVFCLKKKKKDIREQNKIS